MINRGHEMTQSGNFAPASFALTGMFCRSCGKYICKKRGTGCGLPPNFLFPELDLLAEQRQQKRWRLIGDGDRLRGKLLLRLQ